MGERRNAASLFSHSLKTPLSSVKVGSQLLIKHLNGKIAEKDQQLLEMLLRNATTLELRINKLTQLAQADEDGLELNLSLQQLEYLHDLKEGVIPEEPAVAAPQEARETAATAETPQEAAAETPKVEQEPEADLSGRIVVHADPEIADLIPKFLENRLKDISAIREALDRGDFETIRTLGHSMKGAGGGFGFPGITDIGKTLEDSAKAADAEQIQRGLEALAVYMNSVEVVYDEL